MCTNSLKSLHINPPINTDEFYLNGYTKITAIACDGKFYNIN
jgi:hypothetical protein